MTANNNLAPIALFAYNRPDHLAQTLEALQKNKLAKDSDLFVFCDGIKNENNLIKVNEVHKIVDAISGFKNVVVKKSTFNKGLAGSIISGVGEVIESRGKVIVLEDDLVVSPYFLQFMNDGLDFYEKDDRVISVHGYVYPLDSELPPTFFLKGADCWGWATWKRGWKIFNSDGAELLAQLQKQKLEKEFNFDDCYSYTKMLKDQIAGKNNSWAIRWHASAFLANKLTLYPGQTLVKNIGFDDSGTHCGSSDGYNQEIFLDRILVEEILVKQNKEVRQKIKAYLAPRKNFFVKIINKIKRKIEKKRLKRSRKKYGWFSSNLNWRDLEKSVGGYDSQKILEKCKNSLLKVKNGEAIYERDSVIFKKIEYSWPIMAALLWAASRTGGKLNVLDFGGSLGSTYYQSKNLIAALNSVRWNIVEQKTFVEVGKKYFEDDQLKFYYDIESCVEDCNPKVLLLSSVLQYLEEPHDFLDKIKKYNFEFIFIDRTGFISDSDDMMTIQKVSPDIYEASYPCWFFNKEKFLAVLCEGYQLVSEFDSSFIGNVFIDHKIKAQYFGFILKKQN